MAPVECSRRRWLLISGRWTASGKIPAITIAKRALSSQRKNSPPEQSTTIEGKIAESDSSKSLRVLKFVRFVLLRQRLALDPHSPLFSPCFQYDQSDFVRAPGSPANRENQPDSSGPYPALDLLPVRLNQRFAKDRHRTLGSSVSRTFLP